MMKKQKKLHSANFVDVLIVIFFILAVSISIIPMLNILSLSISDRYAASMNPGRLFPDFNHVTLLAYKAVITSKAVYRGLLVSLLVVIVGTAVFMTLTTLVGFAVSNEKVPGRKIMMTYVLFTILFSGGLIPTYLAIDSYNMMNTFWVLVIPYSVNGYNVVLIKNHIANIPKSLLEAAEIDGANPFVMLMQIILPLCIPVMATIALFCAIGKWNDWQTYFLYARGVQWLKPFQNVLQDVVVNVDITATDGINLAEFGVAFQNALIVISLIPIVGMYLLAQKYLIKGLFIGSVKE